MATKGAEIEIRAKESATPVIKKVSDAVDVIAPAANKAGGASDAAFNKIKDGSQKAGDGVDGLAKKFGEAKTQVAALAGINIGQGMVKDVLATADAVNNLQSRIELATGEGNAFKSSFKEIGDIAQRTGSNLEQTGILFTRLTEAGKSAGLSSQAAIAQALTLTETINQAVQLSGGSAESSKAAVTQLIQGLQSGVLRGEEFNSVMEQAPRLSKALADSLGVTAGELRKMAEAGTLSADTVIKSLKGQSATLQAEFATLPITVGRSVEKLQTQWALYIGDLDKSRGITAKVAQGLDLLAGNLNGVIQTAQAGGAAWLGYKAAQKLVGDGAVDTAVKVTRQAAASAEAAAATTAHGAAAGKAGAQLVGYGTAAAATGAQVAAANAAGSAAAVGGFKTATAGVVGFLGKLGSIGAIAFAAYEVTKLAFSAGDALLQKWAGLSAAEEALALSDKKYADTLKESQAAQEAQTAAKQAAIDKTFGLTKESAILVGKFGELVKAGDSVSEAIGKIGKDFDLSTVPGIQAAASVLDKLLADGKITATLFKLAWSDALKGVDLAELEVKARVAFAGTARGAVELQQALDAGVREAIKRTGLDFEVISGGMGKAARSAINDTDAIIKGLDSLKAKGVDTGQALTASLSKGRSSRFAKRWAIRWRMGYWIKLKQKPLS
jgi:tape measure domain-containing protein